MGRDREGRLPQQTLLYVHVRRAFFEAGAAVAPLVADVNEKVKRHGAIVLANGQFLRRPISPDWNVEPYLTDETTMPFEHSLREWGEEQRRYFSALWGVTNPY